MSTVAMDCEAQQTSIEARERMELKDIVKNNEVRFAKYRQGFEYYTMRVPSEGVDYPFPVPLSDIVDATPFH